MSGVGIVGLGISGLHLALYLQRAGVPATLYSAAPPEALRDGPALNFAFRWGATLDRERSLGLELDASPARRLCVRGPQASGIDFCGAVEPAGDGTDFRIYLPQLLETFLERGGRLRVQPCGPEQLSELTGRHDLVVVAAGRAGFAGLFEVDADRSPFRDPPRAWTVAMYDGLEPPPHAEIEMTLLPGLGEVFHMRYRGVEGVRAVLGLGAVPGGPLDRARAIPFPDYPAEFTATVREIARDHVPHVHARLDAAAFAPTRPLDVVRAALTPVVRRAWTMRENRPVLAVGDAWILNDPLAAQGANLGSRTAFALGAAIAAGGPYDAAFCHRAEAAMWAQAQAPVALSNALLEPPPPPVLDVLVRASQDPALAARIASGFGRPEDLLALLSPAPVAT